MYLFRIFCRFGENMAKTQTTEYNYNASGEVERFAKTGYRFLFPLFNVIFTIIIIYL